MSRRFLSLKRLVVITVGKTHSGKTTFARKLKRVLENSIVMDQDIHAEFINTYYKNLQPIKGPNTLKHAISKLIVDYTKENTDFHLIISNSNRVAKFNERAIRLYEKFGFTKEMEFESPSAVFITMVKNQ